MATETKSRAAADQSPASKALADRIAERKARPPRHRAFIGILTPAGVEASAGKRVEDNVRVNHSTPVPVRPVAAPRKNVSASPALAAAVAADQTAEASPA